jgi:hypothetical protein
MYDLRVGKIAVIEHTLVKNKMFEYTRTKVYMYEAGIFYEFRTLLFITHGNRRKGEVCESEM